MQILKLNVYTTPPERWTRWAAKCDAGVFQSRDWVAASLRDNGSPRFFVWTDDQDAAIGIAAGQLLQSRLPLIGKHSSILELSSLPSLVESQRANATDFVESLAQYASENGCRMLKLESQMSQILRINDFYLGANMRPRLELFLPLTATEEDLWSGLHGQHRRKIRKARKHGLVVETTAAESDILAFRDLQRSSRERRLSRGGSGEETGGDLVTRIIKKSLATGIATLFVARSNDAIVSGAVIASYLGRSFYVYGGSNAEGFRSNAPGLVFWEAIAQLREKGNREFNFGGVPAGSDNPDSESHGLYRFKAGFGCEQRELADLELSLRPWTNRMLNLLGAIRLAA